MPGPDPGTKFLAAVEENLAAVILRAHREVNPIRGAALLHDEFVKLPFRVSPGSGHFVTVTDYPELNITLVWIVTGTDSWV